MPLDSTNFNVAVIPHPSFTEAQAKLLLGGLALLESEEWGFDMGVVIGDSHGQPMSLHSDYPTCGTAGCIKGHIIFAANRWLYSEGDLGMPIEESHALFFFPATRFGKDLDFKDITRPMAIAALRRFIECRETWFDEPEAA